MARRFFYLSFLLFALLNHSVVRSQTVADQTEWTERELGKVIMRADRAARKKQWSRAIKYGEKTMQGLEVLNKPTDARYIAQLKNLNKYYDKAKQLNNVAARVKKAYELSRDNLGIADSITIASRQIYYKLLTTNKKYIEAIPLVLEGMSILGEGVDDQYIMHHYLKRLYSLYGITGQRKKEEEALKELLELNQELEGDDVKDNLDIILNLAKNYCIQKKAVEFNQLMTKYNLKYEC